MRFGSVLALAIGCVLAGAAPAAVFTVDSSADAADAAPGDGVCENLGGLCTLRAAVQEANALAGEDTIELGTRVHYLAIPGAEPFAATGDLDVREDLVVAGEGPSASIVDGGQVDRVFEVLVDANLTLRDLTVRNGLVVGDGGGGIRLATSLQGGLRLEGVHVTGNQAPSPNSGVGGAILANSDAALLIYESVLRDNEADRGGAVFSNAPMIMEDTTVAGNRARAASALQLYDRAFLERSTVSDNTATGNFTIVTEGTFSSIQNTTLSGNLGPTAILYAYEGELQIRNATIVDNEAFQVILVQSAAVNIANTIVVNPLAGSECAGTAVLSHGHNLDSDSTCAAFGPGDYHTLDPGLGPLLANGGPTLTHAPRAGSLAIDRGSLDYCPAVDQRGIARSFDGDGDGTPECDIGSVEYAPEPGAAGAGATALAGLFALVRFRRAIRQS